MDEELLTLIAEDCGVEAYMEELQAFAKRIRDYERMRVARLLDEMKNDTAASIAVWMRELC